MLQVGEFVLNVDSRKLYDPQKNEIAVAPTLFALLSFFLEHQNQVCSKEMIIENVWKDKVVVDANVNQNLKKLRDLLGDSAQSPKYIETVKGEGYRFIANSTAYNAKPIIFKWQTLHPWLNLAIIFVVLFGVIKLYLSETSVESHYRALHPITTLKGLEYYPQITPDKKFILFSYKLDQSWDVYVKSLEQEYYRALLSSPQNERFPAISPDGKQLIYENSGGEVCGLYIVDIDLEKQIQSEPRLVKQCKSPTESQKAEWINRDEIFISVNDDLESPANIYRYNLITKEQKLISKPDSKGFGDYSFKYSKQLNKLAYIRNIGWSSSEIWVYDLEEESHIRVKTTPMMLSGLDWDQQGMLYFQSGQKELSKINIDGNEDSVVADFSEKIYFPFIVAENKIGIVAGEHSVVDVGVFNLETHSKSPLISSSFNDYFGFSGKNYFGFVSDRSGNPEIWLRNSLGVETQLTNFDESYELRELSSSEERDLIIFVKSGHINIIDTLGSLQFDSKDYNSQVHMNPIIDVKNNQFIYAIEKNSEWSIETRQLDSPGVKRVLVKGTSARPCIVDDCLFYFKYNDPHLYKYTPSNNNSQKVANIEFLTKVVEWDILDDDTVLYTNISEGKRRLNQLTISTQAKKVLFENNGEMFTLNRQSRKIYYNLRSQGNTDIMFFEL